MTELVLAEEDCFTSARLWSITQLADYLAVPKSWVYDRTHEKRNDRIPHYKIGKYLRFDPRSQEFQDWLKRNFQM